MSIESAITQWTKAAERCDLVEMAEVGNCLVDELEGAARTIDRLAAAVQETPDTAPDSYKNGRDHGWEEARAYMLTEVTALLTTDPLTVSEIAANSVVLRLIDAVRNADRP